MTWSMVERGTRTPRRPRTGMFGCTHRDFTHFFFYLFIYFIFSAVVGVELLVHSFSLVHVLNVQEYKSNNNNKQ